MWLCGTGLSGVRNVVVQDNVRSLGLRIPLKFVTERLVLLLSRFSGVLKIVAE